MNTRYLITGLVLATGMHLQAFDENPTQALTEDSLNFLYQQEKRLQAFNDGYPLTDAEHGINRFARNNADEIGQELEYFIDHNSIEELITLRDQIIIALLTCIHETSFSTKVNVANFLQTEPAQTCLIKIFTHWENLKEFSLRQFPQEHCPILHTMLQRMHLHAEQGFIEFLPLLYKHTSSIELPTLDKKEISEILNDVLPAVTSISEVYITHFKNNEAKKLAKNVVQAWMTMIKGKADLSKDISVERNPLREEFNKAVKAYGASLDKAIQAALLEELKQRNLLPTASLEEMKQEEDQWLDIDKKMLEELCKNPDFMAEVAQKCPGLIEELTQNFEAKPLS